MKILKDGFIEDVWIGKCNNCNAVIQADKTELKNIIDDTAGARAQYYAVENCLFCGCIDTVMFFKESSLSAKAIMRKVSGITIV